MTKLRHIPVAGPSITAKEISYVTDAATNAWLDNANIYHERFEKAFAKKIGRRHAVALPSCTSALHLSLAAMGIGKGDEVIVPDVTWIASAAPISYVGATPVFADIDAKTWCVSAQTIDAVITENTKAIIVVELYGNMPDWDPILELAKRKNIVIIEDSAEAIGSLYKNRPAGSFGATATFSFHGSKTLTTGEGGMLVTDDDELLARVLMLRDHGRAPGDVNFFNDEIGFKYKMSSMQAAIGLAQTERMDELVGIKRKIFSWYAEELASLQGVKLNDCGPDVYNSYWMVTAVFSADTGIDKNQIMEKMRNKNIDTRPFFHPLSSIPAYQGRYGVAEAQVRNVVSYDISRRAINLPSALTISHEDVSIVCNALREILY